jgi:hypothetical protein
MTDVDNNNDIEFFDRHQQPESEKEPEMEAVKSYFSMSEEERQGDGEDDLNLLRDDGAPRILNPIETWADDPDKVKFNTGDLVVYKVGQSKMVYKIRGPSSEPYHYIMIGCDSRDFIIEQGSKLKSAPKNSKWTPYESNPYLRWKREQEKKNNE